MCACPQKENGHLDLANKIVEALAQTQLSGYESRILWAVWRKTYCWHKKQDWISYSQFRKLTKLIDPNINRTLKRLIKRNILIKIDKSYKFNKDYDKWIEAKKLSKLISRRKLSKLISRRKLSKLITPLIKNDNQDLSKLIDTKEKHKRNYTKETTLSKDNGDKVPKEYGNKDINLIIKTFIQLIGTPNNLTKQRHYCHLLLNKLKKNQDPNPVQRIINSIQYARQVIDEKYAPAIASPEDLYRKYDQLRIYYGREKKSGPKIIKL